MATLQLIHPDISWGWSSNGSWPTRTQDKMKEEVKIGEKNHRIKREALTMRRKVMNRVVEKTRRK